MPRTSISVDGEPRVATVPSKRMKHTHPAHSAVPLVIAGITTALVGLGGAGLTAYDFVSDLQSEAQSIPAEPGTYTLDLEKSGSYTLFNQRPPNLDAYGFTVSVHFQGLDEELVRETSVNTSYSTTGRVGNGVAEFEADVAGRYEIEIRDVEPMNHEYEIVVSRIDGAMIAKAMFTSMALAGGGFVGGVVLVVLGINRSRRRRN